MEFFSANRDIISFNPFDDEPKDGLRECQVGGFCAVRSHFTTYPDEPALVSMPTGSGKTALMMLLSFNLSEKQVLIVTASDILRTQTADKFRSLDGLDEANVLADDYDTPSVEEIDQRITEESEWDDIDEDVVVALPQTISKTYDSPQHDDIVDPPSEKFDLVFFDEAHRSRAPSWQLLLEEFRAAKQVLLTATPFRRDRQTLPGRLVYHYPLANAIDKQLYQPLEFEPVSTQGAEYPADVYAAVAKEKLEELRVSYSEAKILIRCERINDAKALEHIYYSKGIDVKAIHSKRTSNQNATDLESLQEGDIDGVVAVGMLGEGIDIPGLKIAVLHNPPKSFAYTLQLLGRVARPTDPEISAQILADPADLETAAVEEEVKRLYHEDKGWEELVPNLAEEYTSEHSPISSERRSKVLRGVNEVDIEPYLSTRLFHVKDSQFDPTAAIELDDDTITYKLQVDRDDFVGVITEQTDSPTWGRQTPLEYRQYELHLFYFDENSETLFESTSASDTVVDSIRDAIIDNSIDQYGGESLVKIIQGEETIEYQVAGLANALGTSGSLPSYKMLLGDRVEGAVRQTDAKAFTQGHAIATVDGESVGISHDKGRVWSNKRQSIEDFIDWCTEVASKFSQYPNKTSPAKLGLGEIIELEEFSEDPIFGSLNPKLRQHDISIDTSSVSDPGGKEPISELELTSLVCGSSNTVVEFEFEGIKGQEAVTGVYDLTTNEVRGDIAQCVFFIDDQDGEKEYVGERFFDRYPLYFFTGDGSLISKGHAHKTESKEARVPDECFVDESLIDWSECATWNEFGKTKNGDHLKYSKRLDIFGWVKNHIEEHGEDDQIVFCDHTQGEIADYIQIERTSKEITFYHCKARNENKDSGARLDDIREVVGQVLRSITWVRDSGLPGQIDHRDENTQYPHFVSNGSSFSDFKSNFSPMAWDFTVAIVQPGLNYEDAKSKNNINTLLLTCKEWLEGIDASFEIYGDPNNQIKSMSRIKRIQSPLLYDVL